MKLDKKEILNDYRLAWISRNLSIIGRKEVLSGKAKFGIFGDGKEIAQIALAKYIKKGDWRSGYYRDQTLMLALGLLNPIEFFSQLYGDTNQKINTVSGGRLMNNHFGSHILDDDGNYYNLTSRFNSSADISPTAGQMPRLLGLAYASKIYRNNTDLNYLYKFSKNGDEVAIGTIGDASTSEGHFWETINAAGVLQVPMLTCVWDDGWGISVPKKYQTTKESISELLSGYEPTETKNGVRIVKAKAWDYENLCKMFEKELDICRTKHIPVVAHIEEMVQIIGHSTSGSHERYKTKEQLEWEKSNDPILKMKEWILENDIANIDELEQIQSDSELKVKEARNIAWKYFTSPRKEAKKNLISIIRSNSCKCNKQSKIDEIVSELELLVFPDFKDLHSSVKKILREICKTCSKTKKLKSSLTRWLYDSETENSKAYNSHLYSESKSNIFSIPIKDAIYNQKPKLVNGREILRDNFDALFAKYPNLVSFGEDTGFIGGVNQSFEGLQKKYGENRISDTGIREATIIGQGIGLALRGIRPIAEIQYLDYIMYALQTLSDDLACLEYRTRGRQKAPLIIRTRGHRLEGIWHSGSPMGTILNSVKGIRVCTPRNMTKAAGFYNLLLQSDEPAIVIEPLNAYRLKEEEISNYAEFTTPLGIPEIVREGKDISLVTYGSCVRIAEQAVKQLKEFDIDVELIDVQTLIPFDVENVILESIKKTSRVVFFDEDVPGGATSFMMQKVLEEQDAYQFLDSKPVTITAKNHRPAYGTDGDYFSNPNAENVFEGIYEIMHESNPLKYPSLY
ncbi:MAG: thiamine pyrophosphate-dependent enzyme [Marinifilaceae bacterium]|jgi:pyruvate/2-oxoglutarate/acetoin dehydrogenase E1 component/TPP-dependent pyruvate/acetoin dehydrogenase alpha subunit|nr:thiamine pyrophosphate-dependent enzyme [Marinifilaceae bacterium]